MTNILRAFISTGIVLSSQLWITSHAAETVPLRGLGEETSVSDGVLVQPPSLKALISINSRLNPFELDALTSRTVSLEELLRQSLNSNLDLGIRNFDAQAKKFTWLGSMGQFLPDVNLAYRYQYLKGKISLPFGQTETVRLNSPFIIAQAGYTFHIFRPKTYFTALQNRNHLKAARHQRNASLNDVLFETTKRYYDLLSSEAELQIRIKAVETSQEQLEMNKNLLDGGKATLLDVLQAKTQLATDRQALIDQQIARRNAAINLAEYANLDQSVDLNPANRFLRKCTLIADEFPPGLLIATAITHRPELKQYEELRLAAKQAISLAASPLLPTFDQFGTIYGIGETLTNKKKLVATPSGAGGSGGGVGTPISLVTAGTAGSSTSTGGGSATGAQMPMARLISRQIKPLYVIGYQARWDFSGLGTTDLANVASAKYQARQAALQSQQQLNMVTRQIRQSYLNSLSTDRKIEETAARVDSSTEELRLAQLRFQYGVGKNIDVLKAQQDCTSALIDHTRALVNFDVAQAQLLHDLGIISVANLTRPSPISSLSE